MADVRVNIKGDSSKLNSEVEKAKKKIRGLGDAANRASDKTRKGFSSATGEVTDLASSFQLVEAGLQALAITAQNTFKTFRQEATRAASGGEWCA